MPADSLSERLLTIRQRFADQLDGKLDDSFAALPALTRADAEAIDTVVVVHRRLHELCGLAPSIGFPGIGSAARAAETVLRDGAHGRRPLTPDEAARLRAELDHLRAISRSEISLLARR